MFDFRSERVSKSGVNGVLLTEAKYINLSLHFLEQVSAVMFSVNEFNSKDCYPSLANLFNFDTVAGIGWTMNIYFVYFNSDDAPTADFNSFLTIVRNHFYLPFC